VIERPESDVLIVHFAGCSSSLWLAIGATPPHGYIYDRWRNVITSVEGTASGDVKPWLATVEAWIERNEAWIERHATTVEKADRFAVDKLRAARDAAVKLRARLPQKRSAEG
jgi:hypothetical protein